MRRLLIVFGFALPALILIGWLVAAQLPIWNAPQASWFSVNTPGICAAVESLKLYQGQRADVGGIGQDKALADAKQFAAQYYTVASPERVGYFLAVLGVEATLPAQPRQGYYVVVRPLTDDPLPKAAVMYLDAATGDVRALLTTVDDLSGICVFDRFTALLAAVKSPPLLLLIAYGMGMVAVMVGWWLLGGRLKRRGIHR